MNHLLNDTYDGGFESCPTVPGMLPVCAITTSTRGDSPIFTYIFLQALSTDSDCRFSPIQVAYSTHNLCMAGMCFYYDAPKWMAPFRRWWLNSYDPASFTSATTLASRVISDYLTCTRLCDAYCPGALYAIRHTKQYAIVNHARGLFDPFDSTTGSSNYYRIRPDRLYRDGPTRPVPLVLGWQ